MPMKLPQLAVRELFWLILVAAVLCLWYVQDRKLRAAYSEAYKGVSDVMKVQNDSRKEGAQMRSFLESEGYKVNWKGPGSLQIIRPDGTSSPSAFRDDDASGAAD